MRRIIYAFNGDLESRLGLHWLVHERGFEVHALSINLGQGIYLEPLGELALELGAKKAEVVDRRDEFLHDFAIPVLQANAVYQTSCFLGSALARYVIAQEMVRVAQREGCEGVAHGAASKGNDQVRMEAAIAAQAPKLEVIAPVRQWNLRTMTDRVNYARRRRVPIETPTGPSVTVDRNLWGVSTYLHDLTDSWQEPPEAVYSFTKAPEQAPDTPAYVTLGFTQGVPTQLEGKTLTARQLINELNQLGGEHSIGRSDVMEDKLFGIKSREFYEAPGATLLLAAHRDLQSLVHSRELLQLREMLSRRYAELVYMGMWFHDLRRSLQGFFASSQQMVSGEVRLKLYKGTCRVVGRRAPHSLYDGQLASQWNLDWFDTEWSNWAQGFTSLWTLPQRLAAMRQAKEADPS